MRMGAGPLQKLRPSLALPLRDRFNSAVAAAAVAAAAQLFRERADNAIMRSCEGQQLEVRVQGSELTAVLLDEHAPLGEALVMRGAAGDHMSRGIVKHTCR